MRDLLFKALEQRFPGIYIAQDTKDVFELRYVPLLAWKLNPEHQWVFFRIYSGDADVGFHDCDIADVRDRSPYSTVIAHRDGSKWRCYAGDIDELDDQRIADYVIAHIIRVITAVNRCQFLHDVRDVAAAEYSYILLQLMKAADTSSFFHLANLFKIRSYYSDDILRTVAAFKGKDYETIINNLAAAEVLSE